MPYRVRMNRFGRRVTTSKTWKKKKDAKKFADLQNKGTGMNARVIKV